VGRRRGRSPRTLARRPADARRLGDASRLDLRAYGSTNAEAFAFCCPPLRGIRAERRLRAERPLLAIALTRGRRAPSTATIRGSSSCLVRRGASCVLGAIRAFRGGSSRCAVIAAPPRRATSAFDQPPPRTVSALVAGGRPVRRQPACGRRRGAAASVDTASRAHAGRGSPPTGVGRPGTRAANQGSPSSAG
jgi:hypothetical protein